MQQFGVGLPGMLYLYHCDSELLHDFSGYELEAESESRQ
jgi:hypothetical protein